MVSAGAMTNPPWLQHTLDTTASVMGAADDQQLMVLVEQGKPSCCFARSKGFNSFELRANPGDGSTLLSDLPFSALTTPPMAGTTLLMLLFSLAECTWTMWQLAMNMQSLLLLLLKPGLCAKLLSVSCAPLHACMLTVTQ